MARLTPEEKAARATARAAEKARLKLVAKRDKITECEGPRVELPAVVLRDGTVFHVPAAEIPALLAPCLGALCLDVEHSGFDYGHELYELRTIQLGGYGLAVVLDPADPSQAHAASWALNQARKLHAHSAVADITPCVMAGLIGWDEAWGKMHDSVLYAKLTDPKMSGSDANALKELAHDLLGADATAPAAEKAKNALFKAMGCLLKTTVLDPPERNGWYMVRKNCTTMIRYAGSDVLDLAAVMAKLEPVLPVPGEVLDRERVFEAVCARVAWQGFALDKAHIKAKIAETEQAREKDLHAVQVLSGGLIVNPSSPDTGEKLTGIDPSLASVLETSEKTGRPSAARPSLEKIRNGAEGQSPLTYPLTKAILSYRHDVTTLGLLLRPLEALCDHGDSRMRPTVLTINADTGRCSCVRPNGQQFSRMGGIRACVHADPGYLGISADFQGCEIRVAAALSGDRQLLEAEMSPQCYLCGAERCLCGSEHTGLHWMAAHEAFGPEAVYEHRYWCKRIIFSKLFGGSARAGARQVGIDVSDSQRIHDAFEALAPEYAAWDAWLRQCWQEGSTVWRDFATGVNYSSPLDGRRRGVYQAYSGRNIYASKGAHAFGNSAIQGTARELLVDGVLKWDQGPYREYPLLPIHDEILCWVPGDVAEEASQYLRQCMATRVLSTPDWDVLIDADTDRPFAFWPDSS